ncbi:ComEC/Rec2 family competence protein [Moorella sulfitireducens]|uniref:ComEC/Rec2 family competence protein n=1 Tax=Neomoorella sulfitireducens TaxID=2972948 RepID=UPI0021AD2869|nr:MBL fold metallo-hydrolase [Moorella sulfitireducens]
MIEKSQVNMGKKSNLIPNPGSCRMKIDFINVGYGDSIYIEIWENNSRYNMLIDGGSSYEFEYNKYPTRIRTAEFLKQKGIAEIDLLVITHFHEDHVGGLLDVVKTCGIKKMWCNCALKDEFLGKRLEQGNSYSQDAYNMVTALNIYNEIYQTLQARKVPIEIIRYPLDIIHFTKHTSVEILGPPGTASQKLHDYVEKVYQTMEGEAAEEILLDIHKFINNTSIVLKLEFGANKILLPGDVYADFWEELLKRDVSLHSHIFKFPHHGHEDAISDRLIEKVTPRCVIVPVSNDRVDNCPAASAMDMIKSICSLSGIDVEIHFTDIVCLPPFSHGEKNSSSISLLLDYNQEYMGTRES